MLNKTTLTSFSVQKWNLLGREKIELVCKYHQISTSTILIHFFSEGKKEPKTLSLLIG